MKLIIIDGGPASGKNTLGDLLVQEFKKWGNKSILLDLDVYVEEYNPLWIWDDKQSQKKDQQEARKNYTRDIDKYLKQSYVVIAIGERFLTKKDVDIFLERLKISCPVHIFHLSMPFSLRTKRLHERGPHSLINLEKDQKDRDSVAKWYGYVYENINTSIEDAVNIMKLIQENKGLIRIF